MKRRGNGFVLMLALAVSVLFVLVPQAIANEADTVTTSDIISLVQGLNDDGQLANESSVRALMMHLTAVKHYEQREEIDKVVQHMNHFKVLLEHQLSQSFITESGYGTLLNAVHSLIEQEDPIFHLIEQGVAEAILVHPNQLEVELQDAIDTFVRVIEQSTGAAIPVMDEDTYSGHSLQFGVIYVQLASENQIDAWELSDMKRDSFVISVDSNEIYIQGKDYWGTVYGVYDFLERYIGARWLFPGEGGEIIPEHEDVSIENVLIKEEPSFMYRTLSPLRDEWNQAGDRFELVEWAVRNKMQNIDNVPIEFSHNMHNLFPPALFTDSPDFYPNGVVPNANDHSSWQPCLTEETILAAVDRIIDYFDENPESSSYSLGMNDTRNFCEAHPEHANYPDQRNSIGAVHMSELYFDWVNQIVEEVLTVHEDKWFGVLAYENLADPPAFPLHPRVVPFLTKDRLTWQDPDIEFIEKAKMDGWNQVASQVGWYDYMYGELYAVPRVYPHLIADVIKYAANNNVFGNYTEIYPTLGDGPKGYLISKLYWDASLDEDDIMQEWYELMVGPAAAEPLADMYDIWENIWTTDMMTSEWFERGKDATHLLFADLAYLDVIDPDDVELTMTLLDDVLELAETPDQMYRAHLLKRVFDYYEASALSYPKQTPQIETLEEGEQMIDRVMNNLEQRLIWAANRQNMVQSFNDHSALKFYTSRRYVWNGWNVNEFISILEALDRAGIDQVEFRDYIQQQLLHAPTRLLKQYGGLLLDANSGLFNRIQNSSFQEGNVNASHWSSWQNADSGPLGEFKRVSNFGRTDDTSMLADYVTRGMLIQLFDAVPGLTFGEFYYYVPEDTEGGAISATMHYRDSTGATLRSFTIPSERLSSNPGEWNRIAFLDDVPEEMNGREVDHIQFLIIIDSAHLEKVYIDDVSVYQYSEQLLTMQNWWTLLDYINEHESNDGYYRNQIYDLAEEATTLEEQELAKLMIEMLNDDGGVLANPSFENWDPTKPASWVLWNDTGGTISEETVISHSGDRSILLQALGGGGGIYQYASPVSGYAAFEGHVYVPENIAPGMTVQLSYLLYNASNQTLRDQSATLRPVSGTGWQKIRWLTQIPEQVQGQTANNMRVTVTVRNQDASQYLLLDDVQVTAISEE